VQVLKTHLFATMTEKRNRTPRVTHWAGSGTHAWLEAWPSPGHKPHMGESCHGARSLTSTLLWLTRMTQSTSSSRRFSNSSAENAWFESSERTREHRPFSHLSDGSTQLIVKEVVAKARSAYLRHQYPIPRKGNLLVREGIVLVARGLEADRVYSAQLDHHSRRPRGSVFVGEGEGSEGHPADCGIEECYAATIKELVYYHRFEAIAAPPCTVTPAPLCDTRL
jgi:hypothetical protein